MAVVNQPGTALSPEGASEAGSMKMPTPIVLPTTSAVHMRRPRARGCSAVVRDMRGSSGRRQGFLERYLQQHQCLIDLGAAHHERGNESQRAHAARQEQ